MVSDYARTQELVTAANNSAGASNEQFEKTLESLDAKLAQLSNAWESFTMGLANSTIIKKGVDILTALVTALDKASQGFDDLSGSISKIGLTIVVLKTGQALLDKLATFAKDKFHTVGVSIGEGIREGMRDEKEVIEAEVTDTAKEAETKAKGDIGAKSFAKKPSLIQKTLGNLKNGYTDIGEGAKAQNAADYLRAESESYQRSADEHYSNVNTIMTTKGAKGTRQYKKGKTQLSQGLAGLSDSYQKKLTDQGKSIEEAQKAWSKYAQAIQKGGKTGEKALDDLKKDFGELDDSAKESFDEVSQGQQNVAQAISANAAARKETADADNQAEAAQQKLTQAQKEALAAQNATKKGMTELGEGLQSIGTVATLAGVGISAFGQVLENSGVEGASKVTSKFASVLTIAGTAASTFGSLMQMAGIQTFVAGQVAQLGWAPFLIIVGAIIAAVVLLIACIATVASSMKKASPANKLKEAEEAAEGAKKAAEEAKNAYDNLAKSFENLADEQTSLDDLTEGTQEWRDAVKQLNSEIMELVETYPELAKFVTAENGVLTIDLDSDEVQDVLTSYEDKSNDASAGSIGAQIAALDAKVEKQYSDLSHDAILNPVSGTTDVTYFDTVKDFKWYEHLANVILAGGYGNIKTSVLAGQAYYNNEGQRDIDKANTEALADALAQGLLVEDEDGNWQAVKGANEALAALGLTTKQTEKFANELGDGCKELRAWGEATQEIRAQQEAYYNSLALNAYNQTDTSNMNKAQKTAVSNYATGDYVKAIEANVSSAKIDNMTESELQRMGQEIYGESFEFKSSGDGATYTDSEGNEKELSMDALKTQLAAQQAADDAAEALEKLPDAIKETSGKLDKNAAKAFEKTFQAKEGGALTASEAGTLVGLSEDKLHEVWKELSEDAQAAFGSEDLYKEQAKNSAELAEAAFQAAAETLGEHGFDYNFENTQMSSDMAKAYANNMEKVLLAGGDEAASKFDTAFQEITKNMNTEDYEKFVGQINAMDWSNFDSWEKLPDTLATLGISLPESQLDNFIASAKECGGAIEEIDVEKLNESAKTLAKLASDIRTGEQGRAISESVYKKLIEADADYAKKFQQNLDGEYVYLGSSMDELREAVDKNTLAQAEKEINRLQSNISAAEILKATANNGNIWVDGGDNLDITKYQGWDSGQQKEFLKWFLEDAKAQGLDLSQLGIEGLGNGTLRKLDTLSEDEVEDYLAGILKVYDSLGTNQKTLQSELVSAQSLAYQSKNGLYSIADTKAIFGTAAKGNYNDEDINKMLASMNSIQAQANAAGVDSITYDAYAAASQEFAKLLEDGEKDSNKLTAAYNKLVATEAKILNTTNLLNRSAAFKTFAEDIGEVVESLDGTVTGADRIQALQQAVDEFGITVDSSNADNIEERLRTMLLGGEEGFEAFKGLGKEAISNSGIDKALANQIIAGNEIGVETYKESLADMSDSFETFGQFVLDETGKFYTFVFSNQEEFDNMLEASGEKIEKWVNEYGRLYNMTQEQNALNRQQERTERKYQRAIENPDSTTDEIEAIVLEQLAQYQEEANQQIAAYGYATTQIAQLRKDNSKFADYYTYDAETGQILTDKTKTEAAFKDNDILKAEFDTFIDELEEQSQAAQDAKDTLEDIQDAVEDYKDYGQDEYNELWTQVREAMLENWQKEIDELQNTHDAIVDSQSQLLEKLQEQIDEEREAREREKTTQSLEDQRTQLAYLMADTSGGHQVEIAELQKSLSEAEQNYTDTLVDEALQNLQDANEKAAEQREQQIGLAQDQLDIFTNSKDSWAAAEDILRDSLAADKKSFSTTVAGNLIQQVWGADTAPFTAEDREDELNKLGSIAGVWKESSEGNGGEAAKAVEEIKGTVSGAATTVGGLIGASLETIHQLDKDAAEADKEKEQSIREADALQMVQDFVDGNEILSDADAEERGLLGMLRLLQMQYENISGQSINGKAHFWKPEVNDGSDNSGNNSVNDSGSDYIADSFSKAQSFIDKYGIYSIQDARYRAEAAWFSGDEDFIAAEKYFEDHYTALGDFSRYLSFASAAEAKKIIDENIESLMALANEYVANNPGAVLPDSNDYLAVTWFNRILRIISGEAKFATGGLADFTGPAWLDGTKSAPELVLNAQDTANFIALKDILSDILSGTKAANGSSDKSSNGGDNYFDINISVDSIENDYDVEQMADKIKDMIYDDSIYRNVNTVNLIR